MRLISIILFILMQSSLLNAETVTGRATVIDGDTIEIHGQRIRLHGIDAPESGQSCIDKNGSNYLCGQFSANQMAKYLSGHTVKCNVNDKDRYGRLVAACFVKGEDINERLVLEGWALAYTRYSTDYVSSEQKAKHGKFGIWQGQFIEPWEWRKGKRLTDPTVLRGRDCLIKGNISNNGKIYHTPSSLWYKRTKIDTSKGERWFCSTDEAETAGWRAPH